MTCCVSQPVFFQTEPRLADPTEGILLYVVEAAGRQSMSMVIERSWGLQGYIF